MRTTRRKIMTLDHFLVERQRGKPAASGELTRVMAQLGTVAKIISNEVRRTGLEGTRGLTGETNVQGEAVKKLDRLGNEAFVEAFEYVGIVGALASEEMEEPLLLHSDRDREKYVVLIDPVDGSSNLDVDGVVGSIFSVRSLEKGGIEESILQAGTRQVAAGYILYGTSVMIVYTAGDGVHSFVLDEEIGEFILDRESIRMPGQGAILSANLCNRGRWAQSARKFVDGLLAEKGRSYSLRYSGAMVSDLHQILHRGGIYLYPEDEGRPDGKLRLLYECAPLAMVAEQAGGGATTGCRRVMEIWPDAIHQRTAFAVGSRYEVDRYEMACGAPEAT